MPSNVSMDPARQCWCHLHLNTSPARNHHILDAVVGLQLDDHHWPRCHFRVSIQNRTIIAWHFEGAEGYPRTISARNVGNIPLPGKRLQLTESSAEPSAVPMGDHLSHGITILLYQWVPRGGVMRIPWAHGVRPPATRACERWTTSCTLIAHLDDR